MIGIHLTDALLDMQKGEKPFSITYVKCDQSRKEGGDIMKLENVMLSHNKNKAVEMGFDSVMPVTEWTKKPSHYEHATRNVILQNGMMRKFHIRLLLTYNGKKVFY